VFHCSIPNSKETEYYLALTTAKLSIYSKEHKRDRDAKIN